MVTERPRNKEVLRNFEKTHFPVDRSIIFLI